MENKEIQVTVVMTAPGVGHKTRVFQNDYHKLHSLEWSEIIREMLDEAEEVRNEVAQDHANDNRI